MIPIKYSYLDKLRRKNYFYYSYMGVIDKPLERPMKKIIYIFIFLSIKICGQTPQKSIDMWTDKVPYKLADSSLVFTDKKITLYLSKTTICQMIDILIIQLNNKQTIADLGLVKAYLDKRMLVNLNSKEKAKRLKPYDKILHSDSLTLTYFYLDALASDLLALNNCKIVVNNKVQKSYKIHTFGTIENSVATYHLDNNTIFWKSSDAIKARE